MKILNAIVLVDENWGIGFQGSQTVFIKNDLARFKQLTTSKTIILGRKTLETFPKKRPLPLRNNFVLTNNPDLGYSYPAMVSEKPWDNKIFTSSKCLFDALPENEVSFVVGGESIYRQFFDKCSKIFVTKVFESFPADKFFPNLDLSNKWVVSYASEPLEEYGTQFQYFEYNRR